MVAPPEAVLARRMRILRGIGVAVVVAVVRGPPQGAALHATGADRREYELHQARGAECAVRKIAVVEAGQGEHPDRVQRRGHADSKPRCAHPEHRQARQVQTDEGSGTQPVHAIGMRIVQGRVGAGIEPAHDALPAAGASERLQVGR